MRTFAYIDGFNLYYRMLKDRPAAKWLDPKKLVSQILKSNHTVTKVKYYTARVSARAHDPHAPARQATYLKALSSVPEIELHQGTFMISEPWMPLATPPQARPNGYPWVLPPPLTVKVIKSEEKGSDVNLGVHLVRDAFLNAFDVAVVLTNDSDLIEPIRIVTQEVGKRVGLLAPVKFPNAGLMAAASFHLRIRPGHLTAAQFPSPITQPDGTSIHKPATWV
jgi:uncharacterized LabA/DUF88 family protein